MICPFCLEETSFVQRQEERGGNANQKGRMMKYMACPACESQVPRMYINNYETCPPSIISAVGFTEHGKSVYLATLYRLLRSQELGRRWNGFVTFPLNQSSLDTIKTSVKEIDDRRLPAANPRVFPTPTMMHVKNVPGTPNRTLVMYDTAGETFRDGNDIGQYAEFVAKAETVLFFLGLPNIQKGNEAGELRDLIETYVLGVQELGTVTKAQSVCVVFTKADEYESRYGAAWPFKRADLYTAPGDEAHLKPKQVYRVSKELRLSLIHI